MLLDSMFLSTCLGVAAWMHVHKINSQHTYPCSTYMQAPPTEALSEKELAIYADVMDDLRNPQHQKDMSSAVKPEHLDFMHTHRQMFTEADYALLTNVYPTGKSDVMCQMSKVAMVAAKRIASGLGLPLSEVLLKGGLLRKGFTRCGELNSCAKSKHKVCQHKRRRCFIECQDHYEQKLTM